MLGRNTLRTLAVSAGAVLLLGTLAAPAAAKTAPAAKAPAAGPVDVNSATEAQLEALPGIGAATAKKIIAARPYKSVDEVATKAGIPAMNFGKFKSLLTVGAAAAAPAAAPAPAAPPAKAAPAAPAAAPVTHPAKAPAAPKLAPGELVNINTAPKELLDALPGIGPVKAQAIIEGRPYAKIEDVMKVKGIKEGEFGKIKNLITVK